MPCYPCPRILISKCLGFSPCRYDGRIISSPFTDALKPYVEFIEVCPECEIGLGVPREPIRIILERSGANRLVQPSSGKDITERMEGFTDAFLKELVPIDGAILKSKSPSCGAGNTKVFASSESRGHLHREGTGFFAGGLIKRFPYLPAVDEEQLADPLVRDHFLTRVFALDSFREAAGSGKMRELVDYHTRNKLLLMAYDKEAMTRMGNLLANHAKNPFEEVVKEYGQSLREVLLRPAGTGSNINVLMHAFGYFSDRLTADEKILFEDMLGQYREDSIALDELKGRFVYWATRFNVEYLLQQTYFFPYPAGLSVSLQQV